MNHGIRLFQWMALMRLSSKAMLLFLLSMGDFCTRTRNLGALPVLLRARDREDEASRLQEISTSEQEHCTSYAEMSLRLLQVVEHPLWMLLAMDRGGCTRLFQGERVSSDPEVAELAQLATDLAAITYEPLFTARANGSRGLGYALGATLAIECTADEIIIPGEIAAFGPGGPYGLSLDDPGLFYIKEHASEIDGEAADGAEGWHHNYMKQIRDELAPEERTEADLGEREMANAIDRWFKLLHEALMKCT